MNEKHNNPTSTKSQTLSRSYKLTSSRLIYLITPTTSSTFQFAQNEKQQAQSINASNLAIHQSSLDGHKQTQCLQRSGVFS